MSDILYTGLTVDVRKRADTGNLEFGVWLDGAFVAFAQRKPGGIADDIARAKDSAARAAASAPAAPSGGPASGPSSQDTAVPSAPTG